MSTGADKRWVTLASVFPATLNTETEPTKLTDGQSPDAYGMDIDHPGYLASGSAPTGTTHIAKTFDIDGNTYPWYFQRLWRASGSSLQYGYPEYQTVYLPHEVPLGFFEDSNDLVTFFPVGGSMFVAKSTGGYFIPNAISRSGNFIHTDIQPPMKVAAAANAVELTGLAFVSNAAGVYAWDGQNDPVEITAPVRSNVTARYASVALTRDEAKRRLVGGTAFVYDPASKRFFDFSQTGFRFTTRTMVARDPRTPAERPFMTSKLRFFIENTTQDDNSFVYQVKRDTDWEDEETVEIRYTQEARAKIEVPLRAATQAMNFTMRLTSITAGMRIKSIQVEADLTANEQSWSQ